jgi:streptomycin 6-kinase
LRAWAGDGAVVLHDAVMSDDTAVLLLERCLPGTALAEVPEPEQDEVVAGLLRRMWTAPVPDGHVFRPLASMCDAWAAAREARPSTVDPVLVRDGLRLFRDLAEPGDGDVLLCTDLHAENILAAERQPWLVIDPKPYVGDPAYDVLQHMVNCDRLLDDPVALADRMADLTGLDRERVRLWAFARCVHDAAESRPNLADVARRLAPS